jgi:Cys-tRNA(Pro) deacylase
MRTSPNAGSASYSAKIIMSLETPATQELKQRGISFRVFEHQGEITSLEQAARERSQAPEQVVRTILFRLSAQEYLLVMMPGPRQISWKALRAYLQQNRLTMASDEELLEITGYRPGTVTPFGLPLISETNRTILPIRVLADRSLLSLPEVSLGSGVRGIAIMITPTELQRAIPSLEIADL